MTTSPLRAGCLLACASVFAGCPDDPPSPTRDAASDVAVDVAVDVPLDGEPPSREATLRVEDALARVALTAGPNGVQLRMEHPDGTPWVESPRMGTFVEVGTGGPGGNRAPDPRVQDPIGVEWQTPRHVASADAARNEVVFDRVGTGRLTLALARVDEGVYRVDCAATDAAMLRWNLGADDGQYHGLGERFGASDARGTVAPMQLHFDPRSASSTNERHVPVPFFVSTRAYGMFVESRTPGAFDVAASDPARVSATFETARASVFLFAATTPARVVAAYTRRTGLPRLPPRWVFGPMLWRNEWRSRDELFADARRVRAEGIPTTTIWIDNPWERSYNDHEFDTARFPDPPGMMRELARMGFKVLLWSTPYLDAVDQGAEPANTAERLFVDARDRGYLVRLRGTMAPYVSVSAPGDAGGMAGSNGGLLDFTSAAASEFWTARLDPLVDLGVRGFKLDYGEDVLTELVGTRPGFVFSNGEDERTVHSTYPQLYHAAYQAALARRAGGDGFLLVRASSWGGQRVVDVIWPGDLDSDFRRAEVMNGRMQVGGLPASVHALTSLAASGFPTFGADTGGFRGTPTRESLLRWAEQTALSPVLQLGGGGESHNPWNYDADATAIYRSLARLHNDLVPYLRVHAAAASRDGTPPVRALALAFPDDAGSRAEADAYLLGDDLYVAPVLAAGATRRRVHVPPGAWVHWFTSAIYRGPADVDVDAPLGRPPLFVRQGAIVPMLADDVATLSTTDAADVVDLDDRRAVLRARIVPAGARDVTLEDGTRIAVDESAVALRVDFTPGSESSDLRAEIDLAHRGAASAGPVSGVTRAGGAALAMAPDARAVTAGCDGCWHYDAAAGVLRVGVRGAARLEVR